jgi:hypothetical protein
MKFNTNILANLRHRFGQAIGGLLLMLTLWQGIALGVDVAIAAPLVATNSSIAKQVDNKIDEAKDRAQSAMKDGKKSAEKNMDKAKSSIDKNAKKVGDSMKDSGKKAKNFFGF